MKLQEARMGGYLESIPVAHEPEITKYFPAGVVTLGVEYRLFDPVAEAAKLTQEEIDATGPDSLFHRAESDEGVSLHVFSTDGMDEYLRFDCFKDEPHYHYIIPNHGNTLIHFDVTANGSMIEWALNAVRHNLKEMLELTEAPELAYALDQDLLDKALDEASPVAINAVANAS